DPAAPRRAREPRVQEGPVRHARDPGLVGERPGARLAVAPTSPDRDDPRMAHVPLAPIGSARDAFLDQPTFEKNRAAMRAKDAELATRRAKVAAGWGPEYL